MHSSSDEDERSVCVPHTSSCCGFFVVCSGEVVLVGKGLTSSRVLVALSADFLFYGLSGQDFLRASVLKGYLNV